jgi:hypothetical protein
MPQAKRIIDEQFVRGINDLESCFIHVPPMERKKPARFLGSDQFRLWSAMLSGPLIFSLPGHRRLRSG